MKCICPQPIRGKPRKLFMVARKQQAADFWREPPGVGKIQSMRENTKWLSSAAALHCDTWIKKRRPSGWRWAGKRRSALFQPYKNGSLLVFISRICEDGQCFGLPVH